MTGINYLLDTCFMIELYNGNPEVLSIIQNKQIELPQCGISPINRWKFWALMPCQPMTKPI